MQLPKRQHLCGGIFFDGIKSESFINRQLIKLIIGENPSGKNIIT